MPCWLHEYIITQRPRPAARATLCKQDASNKPKFTQCLKQQPKLPPASCPGANPASTEVLPLADSHWGLLLL